MAGKFDSSIGHHNDGTSGSDIHPALFVPLADRQEHLRAEKTAFKTNDKLPSEFSTPNTSLTYSADVAAEALRAGEKEFHLHLTKSDNWSPFRTTAQDRWAHAVEEANARKDDIPKGVEMTGSAHREGNDLVMKGSMTVKEKWAAQATSMHVKDQNGKFVEEDGQQKWFPAVQKDGTVYHIANGPDVFKLYENKDSGLQTFAIPRPTNLPPGMDVNDYIQSMVDKARNSGNAQQGQVKFPMYEQQIERSLDFMLGFGLKDQPLQISKYSQTIKNAANENGMYSFEEQEIRMTRGAHMGPPPAMAELNQPFYLAHVNKNGRVILPGSIGIEDMKRPTMKEVQ